MWSERRGASFHALPFHFIAVLVVSLTLADGRSGECDAYHGGAVEASLDTLVEAMQMLREEPLADETQRVCLLLDVIHYLCHASGGGGFKLEGEGRIFRSYGRLAACDGR